jgi:hypothetical protein
MGDVLPPDENFQSFLDNWPIFKDRLVVFLGAGASVGAVNCQGERLPSAFELRNELWQQFKADGSTGTFNPRELGLMSLPHAAAIIEAKTERDPITKYLVRRFECQLPLWPHVTLPYLDPKALFTTNYDELIELGFAATGKIIDVICSDRDPYPGNCALFKPHGSLRHANQRIGEGGLVITQFDYFEMISEYRKMIRRAMSGFASRCVLVVGYSFGDMDIGSELYRIRKENAGVPWYAVFPRSDPHVRDMYRDKLRIRQINLTFEQFLAELDHRLGDLLPGQLKHANVDVLRSAGTIQ